MLVLFSLTFHKSCNKLNYFTIAGSNEYRWGCRKWWRILNDKHCGERADNRLVSKVEFIHAYNESCRLQLLPLRIVYFKKKEKIKLFCLKFIKIALISLKYIANKI